jgi:hypothetical protein
MESERSTKVPTVIDPKAYIIGAADVYYRAIASVGAWTSVGATVDDVTVRIKQTTFNPSDKFNGVLELIREMDYLSKQSAEAEFTMPEFAGPKLALAILGATSSTSPITETGAGPTTTLAAASVAGATSIKVTAITGIVAGMYMGIDVVAGGLREYRVIDVVGTAGAGGTGLTFRDPLLQAHASGVVVLQTDGDGKSIIVPGATRRQPLTAYNDWALVAQSPSNYYELYLYNAISATDSADLAFGNETMAAIKVMLGTRKNGADLSLPSWRLRVPA